MPYRNPEDAKARELRYSRAHLFTKPCPRCGQTDRYAGSAMCRPCFHARYALAHPSRPRPKRGIIPLEHRVWPKVPLIPNANGCREWQGRRTPQGYGDLTFVGKKLRAHRVVYELLVGSIPPGMVICHRCDNPPCCSIEHLFLGTVADNNADMFRKGRGIGRERHPMAKLSQTQVDDIRARVAAGDVQRQISKDYGVAETTVSAIVRGKTWVGL